jgi:hypothetical protein
MDPKNVGRITPECRMGVIYLDQNYISNVAPHRDGDQAAAERELARTIAEQGEHRFAASAWHAYETAKADWDTTREGIIAYLDSVHPLWCANPHWVELHELIGYLDGKIDPLPYGVDAPRPFLDTPGQMWATFNGPERDASVFVGETFRDVVEMLPQKPLVAPLDHALASGPEAAQVARDAHKAGDIERDAPLLDGAWLHGLVPERNPETGIWVDKRQRDAIVTTLLASLGDVYRHCPALHAEDQIFRWRATGNSTLRPSDGVDIQFLVIVAAYCDVLVSSDKTLRRMASDVIKAIGSSCRVIEWLNEL